MKKHHKWKPDVDAPRGPELEDLPLFAPRVPGEVLPVKRPAARKSDPATSKEAAGVATHDLRPLQLAVLEAFAVHGDLTPRDAERLERFREYAPSTIRKRISELSSDELPAVLLEVVGIDRTKRAPCRIYRITTAGLETIKRARSSTGE